MKKIIFSFSLTLFLLSFPITAQAYIGPGMAGSVIVTVIGFVAAFFLALFGILYYPIKRMLKNRKKSKESLTKDQVSENTEINDKSDN